MTHFNIGHHHLHKRKKRVVAEDGRLSAGKRLLDRLMYPVGFIGPVMMLPQVIKIYIDKDASSIALASWLLFLLPASLWVAYGLSHKDRVIVACNAAWVVAYVFVVVGALIY